jgi:hypothetical protein
LKSEIVALMAPDNRAAHSSAWDETALSQALALRNVIGEAAIRDLRHPFTLAML